LRNLHVFVWCSRRISAPSFGVTPGSVLDSGWKEVTGRDESALGVRACSLRRSLRMTADQLRGPPQRAKTKRETNMKVKGPLFAAVVAAVGVLVAVPAGVADNGNASATLSFFSGGGGAHA